jgi:peptidoglycan/xylan/chitin deacetylase (PgdA/CDA1 family)
MVGIGKTAVCLLSVVAMALGGENLVITDARGAGNTRLANGRHAISFEPGAAYGSSATWKLARPLESGWHTVEFEFSGESNSRKLIDFQCLDASEKTILSADLYHLPSKTGSGPRSRIGIHLASGGANFIRWRKNQTRSMRSTPLVGLSLEQGRPKIGTAAMEILALEIGSQGIRVPENLGGHLKLITTPAAVTWQQEGQTPFTTPKSRETTVFLSGTLSGLRTTDPKPQFAWLEKRYETQSPINPAGLDGPVLPLFAEETCRRTIEIIGSGLDAEHVALADFPGGASMAAVQSWDDGIPQDLRAAGLLHRHGWRATFFFNRNSPMVARWKALEDLGMEVGSHSWSHPFYPQQSPGRCRDESVLMRKFLETKVGHPVISFAYPFNYGPAYDTEGDYVQRAQQTAGYLGCRSTMNGPLSLDALGNPMNLTPSAHFLAGKTQLESEWQRAASTQRGVFYLWGHTYEISTKKDWLSFEEQLRHYGRRPGVWYASQGDLMVWKHLRDTTRITVSGSSERLLIHIDFHPLHPWWASRIPMDLRIPGLVKSANSDGRSLSLRDGLVRLP